MRPVTALHTAVAIATTVLGLLATSSSARAETLAGSSPQFRLPWAAGTSQYLTQDANDSCCSDHVGANKYAYDFALPEGGAFDVYAPAAGTLVHVKMSSNKGCGDPSCVSDANYVVIDHGDGTQTTMLHLAQGSLDPALQCGGFVKRGQRIATTGTTGWSTGVHLHVERDQVKRDLKKVCECGPDGSACAPQQVEWNLFWPSPSQPNVPVEFEEWKAADAPDNRRGLIGPSKNADERDEVFYVDAEGRTTLGQGDWSDAKDGGRRGAFKWAKASSHPTASIGLDKAGLKAGVYEVWAYVPLGIAGASASYELRGTAEGDVRGTLSQAGSGGAFRLVRGLERVKIAGTGKEQLAMSGDGEDGQKLALDGFVFHRVGDLDAKQLRVSARTAPERAGLVGFELESKSRTAIGGGAALSEIAEARTSALATPGVREMGLAAAGLVIGGVFFVRRRRSN
jgi:hypothetical protein